MSRIQLAFTTSKSVPEVRSVVETQMLTRPELRALLDTHVWEGNVLHAQGTMGAGTVTLEEGKILVDITLSAFGRVAQGAITAKLQSHFSKIA